MSSLPATSACNTTTTLTVPTSRLSTSSETQDTHSPPERSCPAPSSRRLPRSASRQTVV